MIMLKKTISSAISLLVLTGINFFTIAGQAQSQTPSITFGPAAASGNGCRPGQQIISEDGKTISVLLENFTAKDGKRATCNLRIATAIPPGFLIQTVDVTYQGFRDIQTGGSGFLKSTYSVGAQTAPGLNLNFPPGADIFVGKAPFQVASFSQCGLNSNIGINMNAYATQSSQVSLDTVDVQAKKPDTYVVVLKFGLAPC
jgi:hypothetical protein